MFSATTSGASGVAVENVFSTYLYTGNGSTLTINNGIDLAGEGGLLWIKNRTSAADNALFNMPGGFSSYQTFAYQSSNSTSGSLSTSPTTIVSTSSSVMGFGLNGSSTVLNASANNYASWTFRKQPKFFDVVTFTQASGATTTFNHNLGSTPGCMLIKTTGVTNFWLVYHTSLGNDQYIILNSTGAAQSYSGGFSVSSTSVTINNALLAATGNAFVAYLFAHNAGGFGLYGSANAISCGSFTTDGSGNATVTHGFTNGAQFCMIKGSTVISNWEMFDTQRTPSWTSADARLYPNLSSAEDTVNRLSGSGTSLTFEGLSTGQTYVYILVAAPV